LLELKRERKWKKENGRKWEYIKWGGWKSESTSAKIMLRLMPPN